MTEDFELAFRNYAAHQSPTRLDLLRSLIADSPRTLALSPLERSVAKEALEAADRLERELGR